MTNITKNNTDAKTYQAMKGLWGTSRTALLVKANKEGVKLDRPTSRLNADDLRLAIAKHRVAQGA